ncbi:uncharacterized protein LOC106014199 isoform X2 [Aplysia californica]|uniref:Uncharacterized protein LOC106014199 isoform X2 n=1 Tax=Aplysia californica TaxID=6500 RepID=A0ABM1W5E2_APLCA|nr:uncharacterized protein LOC106014199 isoform X2 [Aplysia californica]
MYILSCGGDTKDTSGLSIWWKGSHLRARVRTETKEWKVKGKYKKKELVGVFVEVELSWNIEQGLVLLLDGHEVDHDRKFKKKSNKVTPTGTCYFARPIGQDVYSPIAIADLSYIFAFNKIIEDLGITFELPKFPSSPELKVLTNSSTEKVEFECSVTKLTRTDVSYFISFYFGKKNLLDQTPQEIGDKLVASMSEDYIDLLRFSDKIYCTVSACISSACNSTRGPSKESSKLVAGVEIITGEVEIYEGSYSGGISVKTVLPPRLYCLPEDRDRDCRITIITQLLEHNKEVTCPNGKKISQISFPVSSTNNINDAACSHRITMLTWKKALLIPLQGNIDQIKDGDQKRTVRLIGKIIAAGLEFDTLLIGEVKVTVKDKDGDRKKCNSVGDPHIRTFDGKKYDNYFEGEFVLYKHTTLPYEVRAFQRSCNGKAACNCGVAIKSGDDVIVLDRCGFKRGGPSIPLKPQVYYNNELTPGTKIDREKDDAYKVTLPTGMTIEVRPSTMGRRNKKVDIVLIYIQASAFDFESTEGLCGTYDNDKSNDFLTISGHLVRGEKEFALSWRVPSNESIYNGICSTTDVSIGSAVSCNCMDGFALSCSQLEGVQTCDADNASPARLNNSPESGGRSVQSGSRSVQSGSRSVQSGSQSLARASRSATSQSSSSESIDTDITTEVINSASSEDACIAGQNVVIWEFDEDYEFEKPTWPTPSGITKDNATETCRTILEVSQTYAACMDLLGEVTIGVSLENCVADVQIMDDLEWAISILIDVRVICLIQIEINVDFWVTDETGQVSYPPSVTNNVCPLDCSGHGVCSEGQCNCEDDWLGFDCSIPFLEPPILISIDGGSKCDKRQRPCEVIEIYGLNFADSPLLTCHLKSRTDDLDRNITAEYITSTLVRCPFSEDGEYDVSVSNNGQSMSNTLMYICFDSVCDNCTTSPCTTRTDVCLIGGQCYADGFYNPAEPDLVCRPEYSTTRWTRVSVTSIKDTRIIFIEISGTHLVTTVGNLNFTGTIGVSTNPDSGKVVVVGNGQGGFDLGPVATPCMLDFEKCQFGLSLSFTIKFTKLVQNGYLFTSCGVEQDGAGLSIYYRHDKLFFTVTTRTLQWRGYLRDVGTDAYHSYEVSWSAQTGLKVFVDNTLSLIKDKARDRRNPVVNPNTCPWKVGMTRTGTALLHFELEIIHLVYAEKEVVNELGIVIGYPALKEKPKLQIQVSETGNVSFTCQFEPLNGDDLLYSTIFMKDDKTVPQGIERFSNGSVFSVISEAEYGDLEYNSKLSCAVAVCTAQSCPLTQGEFKHSELVSVALELTTTQLTITEGGSGTILVKSQVPPMLFCPIGSRNSCEIQLNAVIRAGREKFCPDQRDIPQAVLLWQEEDQSNAFCGRNVDSALWQQPYALIVRGVVDTVKDGDQRRTVEISASINSTLIDFDLTVEVGFVQLTVRDEDKLSTCSSVNDPHITTFDGRTYDNFYEGEFVLYRHTNLPYVVHTFYRSCNRKASCNCAVAVRVDDDVVVLSKCSIDPDSEDPMPFTVKLYRHGFLEKGFRVYQIKDREYSVYLPNGDTVFVTVSGKRKRNFINVWVKAAGSSFGQIRGLCGNFDDDASNDLVRSDGILSNETGKTPNEFSLSWRVPANESLFSGFCGSSTTVNGSPAPYYCQCTYGGESTCGRGQDVFQCSRDDQELDENVSGGRSSKRAGSKSNKSNKSNKSCKASHASCEEDENTVALKREERRKGTDITGSLFDASPDNPLKCSSTVPQVEFEFNVTYIYVIIETTVTIEVATEFCQTEISGTSSVAECRNILGNRFQDAVNFCARDYVITGDTSWSQVAVDSIRRQCQIVIEVDTDTWIETDDGVPKLPPVVDLLCPNDCSNNGNCTNGECLCTDGFAGDDCSVDLSELPTLISIDGGPLCDKRQKNCSSVEIYGLGFIQTDTLRCKLVELRITDSGFEETGQSKNVSAVFLRGELIKVSVEGYQIMSISCTNVGDVFSTTSLKLITYNSLCQTCTVTKCEERTNICLIDGNCYEEGFTNPEDASQKCSLTNTADWTQIKVNEVEQTRLVFLEILTQIKILITTKYNLTIGGTVLPTLVSGPQGGLMIELNGVDQFVQFPDGTGCLWDIEQCDLGLTISFKLKIVNIVEGMVIFGNGAESPDSYGLAMWLKNGRLYLRVSTKTKEWTVVTTDFTINEFMDLKFSWSVQTGLRLFLKDKLIGMQVTYIIRTSTNIQSSTNLIIGQNLKESIFANIIIDGFDIVYCTVDTADELQVVSIVPTFDKPPKLEAPVSDDGSQISFHCLFDALDIQSDEEYQYSVRWYKNDAVIKSQELGNRTSSVLNEEAVGVISYGEEIRCGVQACLVTDCDGSRGPERKSDSLKAELKIKETELVVTEGQGASFLTVTATLPPRLFCARDIEASNCTWTISTLITDEDSAVRCVSKERFPQLLIVRDTDANGGNETPLCGSSLTHLNWMSGVRIKVKAFVDGLQDKTQKVVIQVSAQLKTEMQLTSLVSVGSVNVDVKDADVTSECTAWGDPHIVTFDGKRYNNYLEGEFVLYKSSDSEVRTFLRRCTDALDYASCVCAVAVRVHDDVIVVNKCGAGRGEATKFYPMTVQMFLNGELTRGVHVLRTKNEYKIVLTSGAYVTVKEAQGKLGGKYLNVYVRPSVLDRGTTEGLCGNFDGKASNDMQLPTGVNGDDDAVSEIWRVEKTENSIYTGVCSTTVTAVTSSATAYCDCHAELQTCSVLETDFACTSVGKGQDITQTLIGNKATQNPPQKCLTSQILIEFEFEISYKPEPPSWPEAGITETEAIAVCRDAIETSSSFDTCSSIVNDEIATTIDTCVLDLQWSNDRNWAQSAVTTVIHRCETVIEINVELWETVTVNGTDILSPPQDLLDVLICPRNCSGKGVCTEDGCECYDGYLDEDCSVSVDIPPVVFDPPDGICDTRLSNCLTVTVTGTGFVPSTNLVCYVQKMEMTNGTFEVKAGSSMIEVQATLISSQQVICSIPSPDIYNVVVSNVKSNVTVSQSVIFVAYDSICFECGKQGCTLKSDICLIDDSCYGPGFVNVNNPEETCVANSKDWTIITRVEIITIELTFIDINIDLGVVLTPYLNLTVVGSPSLIELSPGNNAMELDGNSQFVDMSNLPTDNCLWTPDDCKFGLTVSFSLKVVTVKDNMYIFTNGGDQKDSYGVAMYYKYNRFYLTVSTKLKEWTVFTDKIQVGVAVKVEYSWSVQFGLSLYLDGEKVATSTRFIERSVSVRQLTTFYFGRSVLEIDIVYSQIIIGGWKVVFACKEIDEAVKEITTTTEPSTTTEEPTTTTEEPSTTTEEPSTTTEEPSTTTEEPSTTTNDTILTSPESTTEESTTVTSTDFTASTDNETASTVNGSTSFTTPVSTSSSDGPTSTTDESTAFTQTSTTDQPTTSSDQNTTADDSTSTTDVSTSTTDQPTTSSDQNTTADGSTSTTDDSTSTTDMQTSTTDQPTTSSDQNTTADGSTSTTDASTSTTDESTTDAEVTGTPATDSTSPTTDESTTDVPTTEVETPDNSTVTTELPSTPGSTTSPAETSTVPTPSSSTCVGTVDSYPIMPGNPAISFSVSGLTAVFDCQIQPASESGVQYILSWTSGTDVLSMVTLTTINVDRLDMATLSQDQRNSILDNGLVCSVRASNPARCGNGESPPLEDSVPPFVPKVTGPTPDILYEGITTATVSVSFGSITRELYCLLKYGQSCRVTVQARTNAQDFPNKCIGGAEVPALVVKSIATSDATCGGNVGASSSQVTLEMRAVSDGIVRSDRDVTIDIFQVDTVATTTETGILLKKFNVTVRSSDLAEQCKVVGDPHVFTFDQTKYDNMLTGEFVLYKHQDLQVEVHGYFYKTGVGSSACGFAARVGNDVIRVSKCDSRTDTIHPVTVKLFLVGELSPQTLVYQEDDGDTIKVYLPTGALMEVRSSVDASMNLYLKPSAVDIGKTSGLCGVFDGNSTNDLLGANDVLYSVTDPQEEPDTFSNTYRVSDAASIYSGYKGSGDIVPDLYCSCDLSGVSECANFGDVTACGVSVSGTDITDLLVSDSTFEQNLLNGAGGSSRKRRQANNEETFTYEPNDNQNDPDWPTASNITADSAETFCRNSIQDLDGYQQCLQFSSDNFKSEILNCVRDIRRTDSLQWGVASLQSLQASCRNQISSNSSLWEDSDPSDALVAPSLSTINDNLCPNDCSNNGVCNQGVCQCSNGYSGSNCALPPNVIPSVQSTQTNILCARNTADNCNRATVFGANFLEGSICHLTPITVSSTGITDQSLTAISNATYRNKYQVLCGIQEPNSYKIRVSNDGQRTSPEPAYYIVYNSECENCDFSGTDGTPICTQKPNTCLINDVCYQQGGKHPTDSCLLCDVNFSSSEWAPSSDGACRSTVPTSVGPITTRQTNTVSPDAVEFNSRTIIIVSGCVAGLLLIILVIVGVILMIRRRRLQAYKSRMNRSVSDEDSQFERVFNGSYGIRTDKSLTFYNPSMHPSDQYYEHSI